jgi:hypothetical protein
MRGAFAGCCAAAGETVVSKTVVISHTKILPLIISSLTIACWQLPIAYRITRSARASTFGGIVRSTCFAISKSITTIEYRRKLN